MNYELKNIQPGSVFFNAIRIFLVVGFIVAVLSFFILPNPNIRITLWWQKIMATALFTIVYAFVVTLVLWLIARIYDAWASEFDAPSLLQYNFVSYLIPGLCMGIGSILVQIFSPSASNSIGLTFLFTILFIIGMAAATTGLILACRAIFGPLKGVSIELSEQSEEQ